MRDEIIEAARHHRDGLITAGEFLYRVMRCLADLEMSLEVVEAPEANWLAGAILMEAESAA